VFHPCVESYVEQIIVPHPFNSSLLIALSH
jgi:hypothetical protein